MTQRHGLERDLAAWFSDTATPQTPAYLDDLLQRTARSRQRPRWTFLERYLPMTATTTARAATMGMPWRRLGLLFLLILTLVAGLILASGGRRELPEPFGLAAPGLVAYSAEGDIFTVDRATGETRVIVAGPTDDNHPEWSRDGTRLVFQRSFENGDRLLFVVNADGTGLTKITPSSVVIARDVTGPDYRFSPDGTEVAFLSDGYLQVARADGSGLRDIGELGALEMVEFAYRPSNGSEVAFIDKSMSIRLANLDTPTVETLLPVAGQMGRRHPAWSPDGTALAYHEWFMAPIFTSRSHVLDVDSGTDRVADSTGEFLWDGLPTWSNDGERLVLVRGYADEYVDVTAVIVTADGRRLLAQTPRGQKLMGTCCVVFEWAPDDSAILVARNDQFGRLIDQAIIDPGSGVVTTVPWATTSDPTWQRLAP